MRITTGKARHRSKKRLFKEAKGNFGSRKNCTRTVKETILRSRAFAFVGRKLRKRDFRSLWITRLTAACRSRGMRYSQFIYGLKLAENDLNRKVLSELAIHNPTVFDEVVAISRNGLTKAPQ